MYLEHIVDFLSKVDELEVSKTLLRTFSKYSKTLEQYNELGMLFEKIKAYQDSLEMLENCLALSTSPEQLYSIRSNLSKVYNHLNEPLKSLLYSNLNLHLYPTCYDSLMEQSFSYYLYGDFQRSRDIQSTLFNTPNIPEELRKRIIFNTGTFEISEGNFRSGIRKMILGGKDIGIWKSNIQNLPKWNGNKTDKTVLVVGEAGIGDEILNIRFMNELCNRGIKASWIGKGNISDLFKDNDFPIINWKDIDPKGDYLYCESMSLPILLDVDKDELWKGEYLYPREDYLEKWRKILPENFITIRWSGNPYYDHDLHRTLPIDRLLEITKSYGLPIVSLQLELDQDGTIKPDIQDWNDTIAIQYLAKLNITSCTSTAHSASAIGAKCIVLPPICTYYPWLDMKDNQSNWYGENTKIFPQTIWKNWDLPLELMKNEMDKIL